MHVTTESNVPDHCIPFSLSDPKEPLLKNKCQHLHNHRCPMCDKLKNALQEIESSLTCVSDLEEYDNLHFLYIQASKAIMSWKAHQLRSIQQDKARLELLENLDESSVLVTEDWAMKFLPRRYRESQTDWFAKRGLSWHISVVMRKVREVLQQQAFVHIVQNCNQDSNAVVGVLNHVLHTLRKEHSEINKACLPQDNAGCYHSIEMLTSCRLVVVTHKVGKGHGTEKQLLLRPTFCDTLMKEITSSLLQI